MTDLLAARAQMAMSLGFHIIFAVVGIAMPALMVLAEWRYLRTGDAVFLDLAKRWSKGTAILFAVGAVSGTVLSFELGLLWPEFMKYAGAIIGMPFSLEGFAFFTEAIFLGIYLYGWTRIPKRAHLAAGVIVAISGALSGIFVVCANAWMNTPTGFTLRDGRPTDIDPIAAMFNPAAFQQGLHMTLAAYSATGFAVAGIHAIALWRGTTNVAFHRAALAIALLLGAPAALVQPFSGHLSAVQVGEHQPAKLAAMEGHWRTEPRAPLRIGGWPDERTETTRFAIDIPAGLSVLLTGDPDAVVTGLDKIPRDERPPVAITHIAFQVMIACGTFMALVAMWSLARMARQPRVIAPKRGRVRPSAALRGSAAQLAESRPFLVTLIATAPLGFVAIEAGWTVTEVGRQPWVIQGFVRTADALTPMPGLIVPFLGFTALYIGLAISVVFLLYRQIFRVSVPAPSSGFTRELPAAPRALA
ncbi:MAG: cytochrome ubiquinol oxidase subunit I [Gemmatimonadaceae bacterium]|jgi:cytochrome d ubiquinol oxidase subunit I|nr:cytochrome ubiquinol oxidase subunit I [Gemmatimonadaceae bacterium]